MKFGAPSSPSSSTTSLSIHSFTEDIQTMSDKLEQFSSSQAPTLELHRPHSRWPSWNDTTMSFDFFMLRLKIKAQEDEKAGVTAELMCLNMVETMPDEKKLRLSPWFRQRESDNNYNWIELHCYM